MGDVNKTNIAYAIGGAVALVVFLKVAKQSFAPAIVKTIAAKIS